MKSCQKNDFAARVAESLYGSMIRDLTDCELEELGAYSNVFDRPSADPEVLIVAQQVLDEEGIV